MGLDAFRHETSHVVDANAAPTLQAANDANHAGDAPSQPGAHNTQGGTAEASAQEVLSQLASAANAYSPNEQTDQAASQHLGWGRVKQILQSQSNAEVQVPVIDSQIDSFGR